MRTWPGVFGYHHWLFAVHLRLVLGTRNQHIAAGLARRYSADSGRIAAASQLQGRPRSASGLAERLGALVRAALREPSLVSGVGIFPLATRQPIVDRGADSNPGHLRADNRRN